VGLERGPFSLVRITEELIEWKSSDLDLENRINGRGDPLRWPCDSRLSSKIGIDFADMRLTKVTEFLYIYVSKLGYVCLHICYIETLCIMFFIYIYIYLFLLELWEVESILGPRGTAAMYWPIVPVLGDCEDGEVGGMKCGRQGKPKYAEKTWPVAILSTTNPTCQTRARTRAAAVGSQRLTASAVYYVKSSINSCMS
jgi:hypothetical protein